MKQMISVLLVLFIGVLLFFGLYFAEKSPLSFDPYGEVSLKDRVSQKYVEKTVNGKSDIIVYKKSEGAETGSANMVTSVVVNYRSFDTLGEVTVLFVAALGVSLLLSGKRKRQEFDHEPSFILKHGARVAFGIMIVFGVYMFTHGHLTPGGGFPGGSIIAAAVLMLYISDNEFKAKVSAFKATEGIAGSLYVVIGLLGLALGGYFLYNFLPTGTVGEVISSGVIPVVYIFIGLKVGSEISGIVSGFVTKEVEG